MEKGEKNHHFWEISRGGTGTKQSGTGTKQSGTGTKQSGTGTISVLSTGTGTEFSVSVPNVLF